MQSPEIGEESGLLLISLRGRSLRSLRIQLAHVRTRALNFAWLLLTTREFVLH